MTGRIANLVAVIGLAAAIAACSPTASAAPSGASASNATAAVIGPLAGTTPKEAATHSLDQLKGLVDANNFEAFGFLSADEAARAELGRSMSISSVPLDRLLAYRQGSDPGALLTDGGDQIFEVLVDGNVRSSIVVGAFGQAWEGKRLGGPRLIAALAALHGDDQDFVIAVPSMNVWLVGRTQDGQLVATPAFDYPTLELFAGTGKPAGDVFDVLAKHAPAPDTLN